MLSHQRAAALVVLVLAALLPLGLAPAAAAACDDDCAPACGDCVVCAVAVALVAPAVPVPATARPVAFAVTGGALTAAEPRAIEHVPLPRA